MNYHIAETIKEIRRIHSLTQDNLAEIIGMSSGHIGMLEQGRTKPSYDTLDKLIGEFHLDANMFFASTKENKEFIAIELSRLLEGLTENQAHDLIKIMRVGVEIVLMRDSNENSDMRGQQK